MHDLAIVLVSHSEVRWLRACLASVLTSFGECRVDVVVVCNGDDGSYELVEREFPTVRAVRSENRGFAHACNTGIRASVSRYALLLNVDTQVISGTFADLVAALDERPRVGAAGVRQVRPSGELLPTMRNFPSVTRALGDALGFENWPIRPGRLGERVIDPHLYEREHECDWISGSFLALRRGALTAVGLLDERFFLYSEEPDLCLRLRRRGWSVCHLPVMTVLHHANRSHLSSRLEAQNAYAKRQFADKHFSRPRRIGFGAALALGYATRGLLPVGDSRSADRRRAARASLGVLLGTRRPPFEAQSDAAVHQEGGAC